MWRESVATAFRIMWKVCRVGRRLGVDLRLRGGEGALGRRKRSQVSVVARLRPRRVWRKGESSPRRGRVQQRRPRLFLNRGGKVRVCRRVCTQMPPRGQPSWNRCLLSRRCCPPCPSRIDPLRVC